MRKPRQRTGTALPNQEAHDAAASRVASGARYQTDPSKTIAKPKLKTAIRSKPQKIPTASPDDISMPPKPAQQTKVIAEPKVEPENVAKLIDKPTNDRKRMDYSVQILPAQKAQIEEIAQRLDMDTTYVETALRKNIQAAFIAHRDTSDWSDVSAGAAHRLGDKRVAQSVFYRGSALLSDDDYKSMSKAVNDPLNMLVKFQIVSAFADELLGVELDKLDANTLAS